MSVLASLAAGLLIIAPQDVPVTYQTPAKQLGQVVTELSELTGQRLGVTQAISFDVVLLKAENQPLRDVLRRLAEVVDGEWKEEQGLLRLTRAESVSRKQRQDETRRMAQLLRATIDERLKGEPSEPFDADTARKLAQEANAFYSRWRNVPLGTNFEERRKQFNALTARSPHRGFALRLLKTLDLEEVASLPVDAAPYAVVYALDPTKLQRPLPDSARAVVQELVRRHNVWATAVRELDLQVPALSPTQVGDRAGPVTPLQNSARVLLKIVRQPTSPHLYSVDLLAGKPGAPLAIEENTSLSIQTVWPPKPAEPVAAGADKVAWSERSKALSSLAGATRKGAVVRRESLPGREMLESLRRPDLHDPLSYQVSDALLAVGKAKNVVALLPDDLLMSFSLFETPEMKIEQALEIFHSSGSCRLEEDGDWRVLKPEWPAYSRERRVNRSTLAVLLNSVAEHGGAPPVEVMAALSQRPGFDPISATARTYLMLVSPEFEVPTLDIPFIRFLGKLNASTRLNLLKGPVEVGSLSPPAREALAALVYRPRQVIILRPQIADYGGQATRWGIDHEPTEALPNGVPLNARTQLAAQDRSVWIGFDTSPDGYWQRQAVVNPGFLAQGIAESEALQLGGSPRFDRFAEGSERAFELVLTWNEATLGTGAYREVRPKNDKRLRFEELPASFRNAMNQELARIRKLLEEQREKERRGDPPPP